MVSKRKCFHWLLIFILFGTGCEPNHTAIDVVQQNQCATPSLSITAGSAGSAYVFLPDPIVSSDNLNLSPLSTHLDDYKKSVTLFRLEGRGVLKGDWVEVVNGLQCDMDYNAYSPNNQFLYSHQDSRFQEAMAYYYGDLFRDEVQKTGYLQPRGVVTIVAHCDLGDNSSFIRFISKSGKVTEIVCLYDSISSPGAFYGDDAMVTLHELQHATTVDNYSLNSDLNQFWYDEAGALNEAISDFMSLIYSADLFLQGQALDPKFDSKIFSRWALGTFDPNGSHTRGAHACPTYDSKFPSCDHFPAFSPPTLANGNLTSISYIYPDGLGWPFPSYAGTSTVKDIFERYVGFEEIHNVSVLMLGALWDVYSGIQENHKSEVGFARKTSTQLILESLRHLPQANLNTNHSPVTFIAFAGKMVEASNAMNDLTSQDKKWVQQALSNRGLYQYPSIARSNWAVPGPGTNFRISTTVSPGVYVEDNPSLLKKWLRQMGVKSFSIPQGLSPALNNQLDPGEVATLWFDIQNTADQTAGGVVITVTSSDPDVQIVDGTLNIGFMTQSGLNQGQLMYAKINGANIVKSLSSPGGGSGFETGNTYFKTNPNFSRIFTNALWVQVAAQAAHGKTVNLEVHAAPSNGVVSKLSFPVVIH